MEAVRKRKLVTDSLIVDEGEEFSAMSFQNSMDQVTKDKKKRSAAKDFVDPMDWVKTEVCDGLSSSNCQDSLKLIKVEEEEELITRPHELVLDLVKIKIEGQSSAEDHPGLINMVTVKEQKIPSSVSLDLGKNDFEEETFSSDSQEPEEGDGPYAETYQDLRHIVKVEEVEEAASLNWQDPLNQVQTEVNKISGGRLKKLPECGMFEDQEEPFPMDRWESVEGERTEVCDGLSSSNCQDSLKLIKVEEEEELITRPHELVLDLVKIKIEGQSSAEDHPGLINMVTVKEQKIPSSVSLDLGKNDFEEETFSSDSQEPEEGDGPYAETYQDLRHIVKGEEVEEAASLNWQDPLNQVQTEVNKISGGRLKKLPECGMFEDQEEPFPMDRWESVEGERTEVCDGLSSSNCQDSLKLIKVEEEEELITRPHELVLDLVKIKIEGQSSAEDHPGLINMVTVKEQKIPSSVSLDLGKNDFEEETFSSDSQEPEEGDGPYAETYQDLRHIVKGEEVEEAASLNWQDPLNQVQTEVNKISGGRLKKLPECGMFEDQEEPFPMDRWESVEGERTEVCDGLSSSNCQDSLKLIKVEEEEELITRPHELVLDLVKIKIEGQSSAEDHPGLINMVTVKEQKIPSSVSLDLGKNDFEEETFSSDSQEPEEGDGPYAETYQDLRHIVKVEEVEEAASLNWQDPLNQVQTEVNKISGGRLKKLPECGMFEDQEEPFPMDRWESVEGERTDNSATEKSKNLQMNLEKWAIHKKKINPTQDGRGESTKLVTGERTESVQWEFPNMSQKRFILQEKVTQIPQPEKTNTAEKPYQCTECQKSFSLKHNLNKHVKLHTGQKPFQCTKCDKAFSQKFGLIEHERTHTGEKPYKCSQCHQSFRVKTGLTHHERTHRGENPHKCTQCNKSFNWKSDLTRHARVHTGQKPYQCCECQKRFSLKISLTRHEQSHLGVRPYQCAECQKSFSQKFYLTMHEKTHRGQLYKCAECGKGFNQKGHLTRHMVTHKESTPRPKIYQCPKCQKSFSQKFNVTKHEKTHTGQKPYQCTECKKSFTQKSSLAQHARKHTGEKPYQCP